MPMSTAEKDAVLNHRLKNTAMTQPTNIYIALSTADPGPTGATLAEPIANSYERLLHNGWKAPSAGDGAGNPRQSSNDGAAEFVAAAEDWTTGSDEITHFALFDAATGGTMLERGELANARAVLEGDTMKFNDGELKVILKDPS